MKKIFYFLLIFIIASCSKESINNTIDEDNFIRAADMSYLPLIESENTIYYNSNNQPENALLTLKNAGCNTIRIRLWKNPSDSHSGFNEVKALSQRIKQAGMKVWLCIHYSDTWADPGSQTTPLEWQNLSFNDLKIAFQNYTSMVVGEIKPDIVQIGNEINNGFMWPNGNLFSNESQFIELLNIASTTIRNLSPETKIMLHYSGIDSNAVTFFDKISSVNYDYIGLSYYPIWHGIIINDVKLRIDNLGETFNKKVIIAETSYPFTLGYNDFTNNVLGLNSQIISNYPASLNGQKDFLIALKNSIKQSNNGVGFCYWGTEWIAFRGPTSTNGSSWENQSLWDFNNESVPAIQAFSKD